MKTNGLAPAASSADEDVTEVRLTATTRVSLRIITIIAVCCALYYAKSLFLPIAMAIVLALVFSPVVQYGRKLKVPAAVTAVLIVVVLTTGIAFAVSTLAMPFSNLVQQAPTMGQQLKGKLSSVIKPMESLEEIESEVNKITTTDKPDKEDPQEVVVKQPGLIERAASDVAATFATVLLTLVLGFFLLISRDMFFRKLVRILPTMSDKKKALAAAIEMEREVSRYLFTITAINSLLGVCVGTAFWLLDMPNPLMWGVLAASLNFLPYIGALVGIAASACMAILAFDMIGTALLVPGSYMLLTMLEGQFLTPMVLGRRFSMNTVVILLSIAFWGFMWGAAGVFIAVPVLIVTKVICDRVKGFASFAEFLSGQEIVDDEERAEKPEKVAPVPVAASG